MGMVAAAAVWATGSWANAGNDTAKSVLAAHLLGQTSQRPRPKDQAESFLRRARQAMEAGNYETASSFIRRAERLRVRYSPFHLGDTPEKARRDLWKLQKRRTEPSGPAARLSEILGFKQRSEDDRRAATSRANREREDRPQANRRAGTETSKRSSQTKYDPDVRSASADIELPPPAPRAGSQARNSDTVAGQGSSEAKKWLLEARIALARGNTRSASEYVEKAEASGKVYGLHDDTPQRVRADIDKYQKLVDRVIDQENQGPEFRQQYARVLLNQAESLMQWQEYGEAERLAQDAQSLDVRYSPSVMTPEKLLTQISQARTDAHEEERPLLLSPDVAAESLKNEAAHLATNEKDVTKETLSALESVASSPSEDNSVKTSLYEPAKDETRNVPAATPRLEPGNGPTTFSSETAVASDRPADSAMALYFAGKEALKQQNRGIALQYFREAKERESELSTEARRDVVRQLQAIAPAVPNPIRNEPQGSLLDVAQSESQLLFKRVSSDVARLQVEARDLRSRDPAGAREILRQARQLVANSGLPTSSQEMLSRRIDISQRQIDQFVDANGPQIELDRRNAAVRADIERERNVRNQIDQKLSALIQQFNTLMDEHRYAEAELIAKQARELDPDNPVVQQLLLQSKFVRRLANQNAILEEKGEGVVATFQDIERSSIPFPGDPPLVFPSLKRWEQLTKSRAELRAEQGRRRSPKELEIESRLTTPVIPSYEEQPLKNVIDDLSKQAGIPMLLDLVALREMGVESSTPVSLPLQNEISLKSALNLILNPLDLSYIIRDDVLQITSERNRQGDLYEDVYHVADLVIPIPNFTPNGRYGLGAAIATGMSDAAMAWGGASPAGIGGAMPQFGLVDNDVDVQVSPVNKLALGQIDGGVTPPGGAPSSFPNPGIGGGPGGLGGGAQADFDTLIDLIVTTIAPESWDDVGGQGSIREFPQNLSLVISQTQEAHEEITDLLNQLRRLQDLQVTIEVRFITLSDDFFERVGVDFDFDIDDGTTPAQIAAATDQDVDGGPALQVGMTGGPTGNVFDNNGVPVFTTDLDLQFRQGSFGATAPQFGGFDPATAATFGFAILSDIEAFFFIQAAQGDTRSNVLQAPKVTLFNGQQASINDTTSTPFVVSVIPVVGDFAAAQQPVIVVLPEGTSLSVQAVVSNDRRFVRMTVLPFFSEISNVDTFTFQGRTTSSSSDSTVTDDDNNTTTNNEDRDTEIEGTTVQLPSFATVGVQTTVSVPDGGTILLGGIKRLSEGRNERGVPLFSKIPYVNRLFKNVGIGRTTQSLMLMVTPRIIIQEEEEANLGLTPAPAPLTQP